IGTMTQRGVTSRSESVLAGTNALNNLKVDRQEGARRGMVSFELTDEQREIRDWVHAFAEKEIRPVAAQYDESEEFPWPVVKKAAEVGLYGVDFLQQIYGDSTGIMPALVSEELTWGCAGIALAIQGTGLPIAAIFSQGTPEQIATW